ncbi:TetR/AcrR family transcriptional regulator [Deinococcus sp.]|uniref:TetR/AcrR family transcriptional regulator n=1 Tax=Deinococcus sp. TaxID=47478 RepID=UPI003B5A1113
MPKVSEEYLAERQDQVLDAAVRCFAVGGFHATGMADVIRESGLSAGSVYRYYKSKDDLIAAIITRLLAELHGRLRAVSLEASTPAEVMEGALGVAIQTFSGPQLEYARLLPQVWTEALRNPEIARHAQGSYQQIIDHFYTLTLRMQAAGTLSAGLDPRGVAHVMLATVQGFMLQKLLLSHDLDPSTYLAAASRMFDGSG